MKTLADLKRQAIHFTWELKFNSWFGGKLLPGHKFYGLARKVIKVQSNSLGLESTTSKVSWLDWPKANEIVILPEDNGEFYLGIVPKNSQSGPVMEYLLRPVNNEKT